MNNEEKLILSASKKEDPFLSEVFDDMLYFFELLDCLQNKSYLKVIDSIYFKNHEWSNFQSIADNTLFIGLSTLEDRRKDIQTIFYKIHSDKSIEKQLKNEAATTKDS